MLYLDHRIIRSQEIIEELLTLALNAEQWKALARRSGINPLEVFGENYNNPQKADALVERAMQFDKEENLINIAKDLSCAAVIVDEQSNSNRTTFSKLDTQLAIKLGELYQELLVKLNEAEEEYEEEEFSGANDNVDDGNKIIEFKRKLRDVAEFSPSNCIHAIDSKNENTVLKRKAKKLGFDKYEELIKKMRNYYNKRILSRYPPNLYNADKRLEIMIDELFEFLPANFQDDDAIDYLNGIIFDTTFQCKIFNE